MLFFIFSFSEREITRKKFAKRNSTVAKIFFMQAKRISKTKICQLPIANSTKKKFIHQMKNTYVFRWAWRTCELLSSTIGTFELQVISTYGSFDLLLLFVLTWELFELVERAAAISLLISIFISIYRSLFFELHNNNSCQST